METAKGELVPGGLAMIYGLVVDVEYNSKICTLVGHVDAVYPSWREDGCDFCPTDWACDLEKEKGSVFARANLMPINPEADPLHVEEEQCQTA